jgi:hypothetical protein
MPKAKKVSENRVAFYCQGCKGSHQIDPGRWEFNGDFERPTISPSILVNSMHYPEGGKWPTDSEHARMMAGERIEGVPSICHSFVRDGRIEYLNDCTHELRGQTVDLQEFKE